MSSRGSGYGGYSGSRGSNDSGSSRSGSSRAGNTGRRNQITGRNDTESELVRNGMYAMGGNSYQAAKAQKDYLRDGDRSSTVRQAHELGKAVALGNMMNGRSVFDRPEPSYTQVSYNPFFGVSVSSGRSAYDQYDSQRRQQERMSGFMANSILGGNNDDAADFVDYQNKANLLRNIGGYHRHDNSLIELMALQQLFRR